ncbi:hypothetical protein SADUNF_Sadunf14G0131700 [Salix dunnii]|uniref:Uncharacterized protein n=1 Tax=Salix dunnii TaxID=1413687 RepID=A0A835JH96_9ROSI|nr:hypothetical protein SADUNF_Sadunf14G0131700 [Salix dunnii]
MERSFKRAAVCALLVVCVVVSMSSSRLMAEARNPGFLLPQGSSIHQRRSLRPIPVQLGSPKPNGRRKRSAPIPTPPSFMRCPQCREVQFKINVEVCDPFPVM